MAGQRRCYRCETAFDGGNSVSSSCPKCGTMVFDDDSRPTLIPQAYGPGAIIEGHDSPTPRTLPSVVDPSAKTVALGSADAVVPSDLHFPQVSRIGHYDILGEIARGGMGVVYRARDTKLNRLVAVKVLLEGQHASQETIERFLREAQSTARLRHPSIVPIYDLGVHDGRNYLVMEYIVGQPLSALLHSRDMNPVRAVDLIVQVADAVEHAHREGIVHRDLKPANILVDTEWRAKVTDFGLAKSGKGGGELTKSGTAMGTPYYMPPEQARGDMRSVDARSDVYSMGAVLYECLCGQPPLVGENDIDTIIKVVNEEPLPPSLKNRGVPADLDPVCLKCLDKDPLRRYQSARELAEELRRFRSGEGVLARGSGPISRAIRKAKRHRGLLAAGFIGFAAAVTLFGILRLGRDSRNRRQPEPVPIVQHRQNVPFYEPRETAWAGEGWKLATENGVEAWTVSTTAEKSLVASGAHDGSLRASFNVLCDRDHPGTLTLTLFGHPSRPDDGYHIRISHTSTSLRIEAERKNEAGSKRASGRVNADRKWMPVVVERRVDGLWIKAGGGGSPIVELFDPGPGFRRDDRQVSLSVSGGAARVGGLTLEGESSAYRRSTVGVGDRLFEAQAFDDARLQYRFSIPESPEIDLDWEAVYKAALCDEREAELAGEPTLWKDAADGLARYLRGARNGVSQWAARQALAVAVAQLDDADRFSDVLPTPAIVSRPQTADVYPGTPDAQQLNNLFRLLQMEGGAGDDVDVAALAREIQHEVDTCPERPDVHCARALRRLMEVFYRRSMHADAERVSGSVVALAEDLLKRQRDARAARPVPDAAAIAEAARRFGTSAEMDVLRRRAREIQARSVASSGRAMEAVKLVDRWLAAPDTDLGTRGLLILLKADLYRLSGSRDQACDQYRQLETWDNLMYSIPASQGLARTLESMGDFDGARSVIDKAAARRSQTSGIFHYERAFLELARGDLAASREEFRACAADPLTDQLLAEASRFVLGKASRQDMELAVSTIPTALALVEFYAAIGAEIAGKDSEALASYRRAEALSVGRETPYWVAKMRREALEGKAPGR